MQFSCAASEADAAIASATEITWQQTVCRRAQTYVWKILSKGASFQVGMYINTRT